MRTAARPLHQGSFVTQKSFMPPKLTLSQKLAQETRRLGRQVAGLVLPSWGHVARVAYDRRRARSVRVSEGVQAALDEISVLVIYQPAGLLDSTCWQVRWMAARGVAAVVVSNAPLSDDDRQTLAGMAHLVVERPNVGYDFGGYREGILQLSERGIRPRALYVMNDSMWFPLSEDSDILDRSRAAPEDVLGLFVDLDWRQRTIGNLDGSHIQSYFFRFSQRLLEDPEFWRYWTKMSLVSSKRIVIELRELRLARHFAERGYRVGGLHSWKQVVHYLLTLDDEDTMGQILRHQCQVNRKDAAVIEPLLHKGGLSALDIRDALRDQISRTNILVFSTALHPAVMTALGFPFLKKQRVPMMVGKRAKIIESGLHRDFPDPIAREVETWDAGFRGDARP
ncbi:hypothetical protein E4L95_10580 [Paracoccus liaowanqingii]|uniref:Rhamnan synthesis protein F n=1 Tax=Paracoccus liaowanqingii TaxID=2560053 RepID=A0A4Z1CGC0_9RHOB|nr:hypothetical protein E4L95_10580 [Paracoccus liaowanqingii]